MIPEGKTTLSIKTQTWSEGVGQEDTIPGSVETFISKGQWIAFLWPEAVFQNTTPLFPWSLMFCKAYFARPTSFLSLKLSVQCSLLLTDKTEEVYCSTSDEANVLFSDTLSP